MRECERTYNNLIRYIRSQMIETGTLDVDELLKESSKWESEPTKIVIGDVTVNTTCSSRAVLTTIQSEEGFKTLLKYVKETLTRDEQEKVDIDKIKPYVPHRERKKEEDKTRDGR